MSVTSKYVWGSVDFDQMRKSMKEMLETLGFGAVKISEGESWICWKIDNPKFRFLDVTITTTLPRYVGGTAIRWEIREGQRAAFTDSELCHKLTEMAEAVAERCAIDSTLTAVQI